MNKEALQQSDSLLAQSSVIGGLQREILMQFEGMAHRIELKKGQGLFWQDDPGDAMYVVESGSVEISIVGEDGKKLSLNIMRPRDVFGEIAALDGGPRTASATAWENSILYEIRRSKIIDAVRTHPEFAEEIVRLLCRRLRWISQQVEDQALLSLEARLARRLLIFHSKFSKDDDWIHISQSEVADFLNTSRESINKILKDWRLAGLIEKTRGRLRILKHSEIRDLGKFL